MVLGIMDPILMAHIGAEVVAIGGVFFYCNRTISGLRADVQQLEEKVQQLEKAMDAQLRMLNQLTGGRLLAPQPPVQKQQQKKRQPQRKVKPKVEECDDESCPIPEQQEQPEEPDPAELDKEIEEDNKDEDDSQE
jgi:phosphatidylethanolamine-binding protein (PEBP) family uncharacterized protein